MEQSKFILRHQLVFDEEGVTMRSMHYPVRQYNNDKIVKFRVELFILVDAWVYFICHLNIYQGKNKANIGIYCQLYHLSITQKCVANAIVKGELLNSPERC